MLLMGFQQGDKMDEHIIGIEWLYVFLLIASGLLTPLYVLWIEFRIKAGWRDY